MPRADTGLYQWKEYENKTLVHNHRMAKIYKKRYQRAADFQNTLYRFFGLITVVSSTVASTLAWGIGGNDGEVVLMILIVIKKIYYMYITTFSCICCHSKFL